MALPNATDKLIQQGASCNVVLYDATGTKSTLGLVENASYNEDFRVVGAQVLGFYGDVSQDSQGYSCSLTFGTFVPLNPTQDTTVPYLDGGTTTLQKQIKTRSQVQSTGKGTVFSQIDFIDIQAGVVYNSFNTATVTTAGRQIGAAQYVKGNVQMMCIERTR